MKKYILLKNAVTSRYLLKEVEAEEIDNDCFIYILNNDICINDSKTGMLVCKENKSKEDFLLTLFYTLLPKLTSLRKTQKYYNRAQRYRNYLKNYN